MDKTSATPQNDLGVKKKKKAVDNPVVADYKEAKNLIRKLKQVGKHYVKNNKDVDCMFNVYLSNLVVPDGYDAQKFRKQIVAYGIKNINFFHDKIHLEGRESIESYF